MNDCSVLPLTVTQYRLKQHADMANAALCAQPCTIDTKETAILQSSIKLKKHNTRNPYNNPSFIRTSNFGISYKEEKNEALRQFLESFANKKREKLCDCTVTQNKVEQLPLKQREQSEGSKYKVKHISTSLKKKVIHELILNDKSFQYGIPLNSPAIEVVEEMIDIIMLSDGSILVKPKKQLRNLTMCKINENQQLKFFPTHPDMQDPNSQDTFVTTGQKINANSLKSADKFARKRVNTKDKLTKINRSVNRSMKMTSRNTPLREIKALSTIVQAKQNKCKLRFSQNETITTQSGSVSPFAPQLENRGNSKATPAISIIHTPYSHLLCHPINVCLKEYNSMVSSIFKSKEGMLNQIGICRYNNVLGLNLQKSKLTVEFLKSKESSNLIKEKIFWYICNTINKENSCTQTNRPNAYKFFIGKGNNSILVKSLLKQRWWWSAIDKSELENANLVWTQLISKRIMNKLPFLVNVDASKDAPMQSANHLENHIHISNKKALYYNLRAYCERTSKNLNDIIPITFHIKSLNDPNLNNFQEFYAQNKKDSNIWILKPGEYSNRGNGITVCKDINEIKALLTKYDGKRTTIIQKYIENPLLINKRKFDIRCYAMITRVNGLMKAYFHSEGYIRTSCKEYSIKCLSNKYVHLTNDAVQQNNEDYGKYEPGNKLSYNDFQRYLDNKYAAKNIDFQRDINTQIKVIHSSEHNH